VTTRVAVVGGGLSGISAALGAADSGAPVTLLERRARLGGLTWSFRRRGLWFDNGQHVFMRCCTAYLSFLGRIGATELVALQDRLAVPVLVPGRPPAWVRSSRLPAPLHLGPSLLRYRPLGVSDRLRLGRAALALRRLTASDPALDAITFGDWLEAHGQSQAAIDSLWDLIALPTLNLHAADASLALAVKVFRTGLLDDAHGADIGWSRVPLSRLHHDAAFAALDAAGVEVVLGARVESLGDLRTYCRPDAVILATPPETTARLAPPGTLPAVERLGASPIVNVHLVLDRRITDLAMAAAVRSPVQFVFDRTEASGLRRGQCLAVSLSAADDEIGRHSVDLVRDIWDALGRLFPRAARARLVDAVVTRERAATFRAAPGSRWLRPGPLTAEPGLVIAGAWTDTGWPATMESAVRSGLAAAHAFGSSRIGEGSGAMATSSHLEAASA